MAVKAILSPASVLHSQPKKELVLYGGSGFPKDVGPWHACLADEQSRVSRPKRERTNGAPSP
jgi:hypothetical protein